MKSRLEAALCCRRSCAASEPGPGQRHRRGGAFPLTPSNWDAGRLGATRRGSAVDRGLSSWVRESCLVTGGAGSRWARAFLCPGHGRAVTLGAAACAHNLESAWWQRLGAACRWRRGSRAARPPLAPHALRCRTAPRRRSRLVLQARKWRQRRQDLQRPREASVLPWQVRPQLPLRVGKPGGDGLRGGCLDADV